MVLVFGGTTEGKKVAAMLEKEGCSYFYSTKTEIEFSTGDYGTYRYGAFTKDMLIDFCEKQSIKLIIHASHPFAEQLHLTIHEAAVQLNVPVIRYERTYPERTNTEWIRYFPSYESVIKDLLDSNIQYLLALTGVQTIERLEAYWKKHITFFRILPREGSLEMAEKSGFPKEQLILSFPSGDVQKEIELVQKYAIEAILTKESGDSGFLNTKMEVAQHLKIPLYIIQRNALPASFIVVNSEEALMSAIIKTGVGFPVERMKGLK